MTAREEFKKAMSKTFYAGCTSLVCISFLYWLGHHDMAFLILAITQVVMICLTLRDDKLYLELSDQFHKLLDQLENKS